MAAYTRKQYSGAARNTTTTTLLTNVGTTVDIAATTGWPSIAGIPFYVVISPSSIYEEKCLATISGSTLTLDRAKDDTTASEHPIGSVIYPVFTANDADEANELVSKLTTTGDILTTDGENLLRLGVGEDGYFLKASSSASAGIEWASIPTINSLDDVGDVTITTVEDGDFLTYNSSASVWVNETIHFLTVSDTEPTDEVQEGDLWYNSSELELYTYYSNSWVQLTLTPEFPTVEELDNVYIDAASANDVLAFDGLNWYNDTVSNLLGSNIIALSGDVSGSVLFDSSASVNISTTIQPNSVALGTDTTGNYMSDLTQGTGVTITHTPGEGSNAAIAIGQAVATSSSVTFANVNTTGDVVVGGNLTVNGTTTTLNTETLSIEDNIIVLNSNVSASPVLDAGIEVERGNEPNVSITWNEFLESWTLTNDGAVFYDIITKGNDIDDLNGVKLTDPAAGEFLSYDGADWVNSLINLGTDTEGNYMSDLTQGTGVTITHTPSEGSNATIAIGQDVSTSASVAFLNVTADLVGNVTGNLTGDVTGNADTATALETARTIELSGDVSGSASFDGTSNINLFTTVNTASVAINELYGVNITDPLEFQTLEYNGTEWVNVNAQSSVYVRNAEATTITTGTAVYLFGATGDHASVKRADNTSDTTSSKTVGLVSSNILSSENGVVITQGYVDGIDLSVGYTPGDVLWLGKNGEFTTAKPSAPDHLVFIGVVVRAENNGIVYVSTQNGYEIEELHNVKINGVTDGQFLRYNSASTVWVNDTINLGTDTDGDYVQSLVAGTGVTLSNNSGETATPTVAIGQDVATSASVTFANVSISGRIDKTTIRESVADTSVSASVVTADYSTGDIFYVDTAPSSNFTVNLTNAPTDDGKAVTVVLFVTQGATGYIPNAVQVAGSAQTIKWANGAAPTPTSSAGKIDIFSFTFVRRSSAWTVFGSSNLGY